MTDTVDEANLLQTAQDLIDEATGRDIELRLIGGLAIRFLTPDLPHRTRTAQDLDYASIGSTRRQLTDFLAERGFEPDRNFNALYGNKQLYFAHPETGLAIDVMVDKIEMCHTLRFADRLARLPYTLDPMDLLLSKLQIIELNEKDADDCLRLLVTFPLAESDDPHSMDLRIFASLLGDDWGWWRTVTLNLERIGQLLEAGDRGITGPVDARAAVATLQRTADETPKSRGWKLRSRIGERKRWYELPEETPHH
ncbi:MAG: hypothetical protein ACLPTJ_22755 [Solirubrobacteraceae bacterium]